MSGKIYPPSLITDGPIRGSGVYAFAAAPPPDIGWLEFSNTGVTSNAGDVAIAPDGSIYLAGRIVIGGNKHGALFKFNAAGALQWQRALGNGTANGVGFAACAVDAAGNVYVTGPLNQAGIWKTLVAKYDSSGALQWQRQLQTATNCYSYSGWPTNYFFNAIDVTPGGDVYVGTTSFDVGPTAGFADAGLVAKYDTAGTIQWQRWINGTNAASIHGVAYDAATGNVRIVGWEFNSGGYIYTLSSAGAAGASVSYGNFSGEYFSGVDTDSAGNVYIGGVTGAVTAQPSQWFLKFDSALALQWQRRITWASGGGYVYRVNVSSDDTRIAFNGDGLGTYPPAITSATASVYDAAGIRQWSRVWENRVTPDQTYGFGVAVASNKQIVTGNVVNNGDTLAARAPSNGTGIGGPYAGGYEYRASAGVEAAATVPVQANAIASGAAPVATSVAGSATPVAIAYAFTLASLP